MSLLREIMHFSESAAEVLKQADLKTDRDLKSLTRQDLQELFPGFEQFKLRRDIFDIIHKQKPVEKLLRDVKKFIPDQSLRDALSNNGVLVDYLQILKDMKSQMNYVQSVIDAHINLLEEYDTKQPDQKSTCDDPLKFWDGQPAGPPQRGEDASDSSGESMLLSGASAPATSGPVDSPNDQRGANPQGEKGSSSGADYLDHRGPTSASVTHPQQSQTRLVYQMVVAGKTFGAHEQLMNKVEEQVQKLIPFTESDKDYQVTFVFCPISSRIASDVEAALAVVTGDKPVILVLMHHSRDVKYTTSMRTWREDIKVILHVNVFYHETMHGLLKCDHNNAAVSQIRDKLMECFLGSGNAQAVGAESELTRSTSGRDGGNNRPSDSGKGSSGLTGWMPTLSFRK